MSDTMNPKEPPTEFFGYWEKFPIGRWFRVCENEPVGLDHVKYVQAAALATKDAEITRLEAENTQLREAIDYYEIGCTAVGVPHEAERKVLHDCVKKAREIRAALEPTNDHP